MTIFDRIVFSEEDIKDKDRLERIVESEAIRIHQSDEARKGRSLETIRSRVRQGKIAELYLVENFGYSESDIMWHDVIDPTGDYVEVKAYSGLWDEHAPQVARDLKRYRSIDKFKSKWYLLFSVDKRNFYKFIAKIKIKD
jgi:hypothetical protein